jgi:uncharacterized protein YceH (UPF0502 family)
MQILNRVEIRVLGCLAEKELATPEYYPLTLNALVNACNQKSNRDPVVQYDEMTVAAALESLRPVGLVTQAAEGGRAAKYCHNLDGKLKLDPAELAILVELLLRGPQTAGELRQRASRMTPLASLEEVDEVIDELLAREEPVVVKLPRQPGRKEQRIAQLLSGEPAEEEATLPQPPTAVLRVQADNDRFAELESQVAELRAELAALKQELRQFRREFE